jgi:hypothetical protein
MTERNIGGTSALSFIQTAESVEEIEKVAEDSANGQEFPVKTLPAGPPLLNAEEELHVSNQRGFANMAILGIVVCLLAWSLCWMSNACGRPCFVRLSRLAQANRTKRIELPEPAIAEPTDKMRTWSFQEPSIEKAGASFALPLTHHIAAGSAKAFGFNISRRPEGPPISATVTCQPEGNTLAKVVLVTDWAGGCGIAAPLASCRLVQSAPDAESRNMQGAMMSWLSLLLHEKRSTGALSPRLIASPRRDPVTRSQKDLINIDGGQQRESQTRTCLHGIAEDLLNTGFPTNEQSKESNTRLEVTDGLGAPAGYLEPLSESGRYTLVQQGKPVMEIEAQPDSRCIDISKDGKAVACAIRYGFRNPELPEVTGDEDEYLQIDIGEEIGWPETALVLTCVLAIVVFKPKALTSDKA